MYMTNNRINTIDDIRIDIYVGKHKVDSIIRSGLHNVNEAVEAAYEGSNFTDNPLEEYIWKITNLSTGTSARYRVDAGGHLRIIPDQQA